MKKILIPIDGTERSKQSVELVKDYYKNEQVTIHMLSVREDYEDVRSKEDAAYMKEEVQQEVLDPIKEMLSGYVVKEDVRLGKAAEEILAYSSENHIDVIVMTKSTRKGWARMIGSVTTHVVKYAECLVLIVPEK